MEAVQLTGRPRAFAGSDGVPFVPDKRYQLLAYLAYNGEWTGRERVATLFWPDTDTATSKQNLRALLQRVKAVPFSDEVSITPHQLLWAPPTDVARYREALSAGRLDEALSAYSGPLLEGLASDDDGEFSEWLEIEREKLRGDWRGVALARIRSSRPEEARLAADLYRRLLDDDPLDEEAVRVYLAVMERAGRVDEARSAYRSFAARLESEMGLEPTSETLRAFEGLDRAAEGVELAAGEPASAGATAAITAGAVDSLPTLATTFVGRVMELHDITNRLREPACRMLTIFGPGGVGKTRLALQAARELREDFDAVVFVALDSLSSPDEVPTAIAGALGIALAPGSPPLKQVVRELRGARTLLLLDNFEQVLDAAPLVSALLESGPAVKVLVSSRMRLGIEPEWLFPLEGLDYPREEVAVEFAVEFPAIRLFVERARRVRPKFALSEEQVAQMVGLCERVDGLPLAIELAAAWVRALPLDAIVAGINENLDMLETTDRHAVPRHRSIRATFEQSWSLLSGAEQDVMRRLAVFRSAVAPDAAVFVAEAPRVVLAALVDKSLLRLGDDGRYDRHPLVWSYAYEKLAGAPDEHEATAGRHAAYYIRFLREQVDGARGERPASTLASIDAEMPEILAAARWARSSGQSRQLVTLLHLLEIDTGYLRARGYGPETVELLEASADAASAAGWWVRAHDLAGRLGDVYSNYRGESQRGLKAYLKAADIARSAGNVKREAVFLSAAGSHKVRLDPGSWAEELDEALRLARESEDDLCLAIVLEQRGTALGYAGRLEEASALVRESLDAVERLASAGAIEPQELYRRRFFAVMNLAEVEGLQGHFSAAKDLRRETLRIAEESGNLVWVAFATHMLGELLGKGGEVEEARRHLHRARGIYEENQVDARLSQVDALIAELGCDDPGDGAPGRADGGRR